MTDNILRGLNNVFCNSVQKYFIYVESYSAVLDIKVFGHLPTGMLCQNFSNTAMFDQANATLT